MVSARPKTNDVADAFRRIADDGSFVDELKSERLVSAIERQILSGRLAPGARLPTEGELCDLLNVSRSVIRDAIRALVARGLVTVRQGRGTSVAMPSDAAFSRALLVLLARSGVTMGDVFDARATIETRLVGLAATSGTKADWGRLEETLDRFSQAVAQGNNELASQSHTAFHVGILASIHQPALDLMLKPLTEVILVSSMASLVREATEDWEVEFHRPILVALKARNPKAAEEAMIEHFEASTVPSHYGEFLARKFSDAYFDKDSSNRLE
jgi:DNA-binding FadR family transcriptional regulator